MEIMLIWESTGKDKDGFPVELKEEVPVYAEERSVVRSEHYDAMRAGISVKTVFVMRQEDFKASEHLENGKKAYARKVLYDGEEYDIIRAYKKGKSKIELTCG